MSFFKFFIAILGGLLIARLTFKAPLLTVLLIVLIIRWFWVTENKDDGIPKYNKTRQDKLELLYYGSRSPEIKPDWNEFMIQAGRIVDFKNNVDPCRAIREIAREEGWLYKDWEKEMGRPSIGDTNLQLDFREKQLFRARARAVKREDLNIFFTFEYAWTKRNNYINSEPSKPSSIPEHLHVTRDVLIYLFYLQEVKDLDKQERDREVFENILKLKTQDEGLDYDVVISRGDEGMLFVLGEHVTFETYVYSNAFYKRIVGCKAYMENGSEFIVNPLISYSTTSFSPHFYISKS